MSNKTPAELEQEALARETPEQTIARVRSLLDNGEIDDSWAYWYAGHDIAALLAEVERLQAMRRKAIDATGDCSCDVCAAAREACGQ